MQSLLARNAAAAVRRNSLSFAPATAAAVRAPVLHRQQSFAEAHNLGKVEKHGQRRGLAVERLVYGVRVSDDVKISEPVRRVLSVQNGDM